MIWIWAFPGLVKVSTEKHTQKKQKKIMRLKTQKETRFSLINLLFKDGKHRQCSTMFVDVNQYLTNIHKHNFIRNLEDHRHISMIFLPNHSQRVCNILAPQKFLSVPQESCSSCRHFILFSAFPPTSRLTAKMESVLMFSKPLPAFRPWGLQ